MKTHGLTAKRLRERYSYDPLTGIFRDIVDGRVAGSMNHGYLRISVDGKQHSAHRLAWLHVHGEWPNDCIDHINGDRADNRLSNLRDVSRNVNAQNIRMATKRNKLGVKGVSKHRNKFKAFMRFRGKHYWLGLHETPELAYAAVAAKKRELHEGNTL